MVKLEMGVIDPSDPGQNLPGLGVHGQKSSLEKRKILPLQILLTDGLIGLTVPSEYPLTARFIENGIYFRIRQPTFLSLLVLIGISPGPYHIWISPIGKYVDILVLSIIDRLQVFHLGLHSMFSCSLYSGVERGMNHQPVGIEIIRFTVQCILGTEQFVQFHTDIRAQVSSWSPAASLNAIVGLQIGGDGQLRFVLIDKAILLHLSDDDIPALAGTFGISVWIVPGRSPKHTGQCCRLFQFEIHGGLVEETTGCHVNSVDLLSE